MLEVTVICTRPHILVVSDQTDTRKELVGSLMEVGCEATVACDDSQALALAVTCSFDVAVIDVTVTLLSSQKLGVRLREQNSWLEIIILSDCSVPSGNASIFYYLPKPPPFNPLLSAVSAACTRRRVKMALSNVVPRCPTCIDPILPALSKLTDREWQVLRTMIGGCTDSQAAECLQISCSTARSHVRNILHKLQVKNRVQAIMLLTQYAQLVRNIPNFEDRQPDQDDL